MIIHHRVIIIYIFSELLPAFRCNLFFQKRISTAIWARVFVIIITICHCEEREIPLLWREGENSLEFLTGWF